MLRGYFSEWLADWTSRMSGAISVAFTVWATLFPPTAEQARWVLFAAAIVSFVLGSYHIWAKERRRFEEITQCKLIFEIDLRTTRIRVDETNSALRVFATIGLRFDNKDAHPASMKEINFTLHRGGAEIFTLWAILRIISNGVQVRKEDFEGMMIQDHRLTPWYELEIMLGIEDERIKKAADLKYNDSLRIAMQSGGYQPILSANLHPYWEAALRPEGTDQITVTGVPSTQRDIRRVT